MNRQRTTGLAVAMVALMLGGCASNEPTSSAPRGAEPSAVAKVRLGDVTRAVLAVFEKDEAGGYAVDVSATYDIPLHRMSVVAHGEMKVDGEEIHFVATGSVDAAQAGESIAFVVDDSFATASLRASLMVVRCADDV